MPEIGVIEGMERWLDDLPPIISSSKTRQQGGDVVRPESHLETDVPVWKTKAPTRLVWGLCAARSGGGYAVVKCGVVTQGGE